MHRSRAADRVDTAGQVPQSHRGYQRLSVSYELGCHRLRSRIFAVPVTPSTPAWTNELLRNAVAAEVTVTSTEVSPTSTGDRYVRIEGRLGDDEESHVERDFIYAAWQSTTTAW